MWLAFAAVCSALPAADGIDLLRLAGSDIGNWKPAAWETRAVRGQRAPDAVVRDSNGVRFVRFEGTARAAFFAHNFTQPIAADRALLTISWRVPLAPRGADLRVKSLDDSPLRIFVVFQTAGLFRRIPRTLFYSSGVLEPKSYSARGAASADLHVVRISEGGNSQDWSTISVEPAADYARVWGGTVPCVLAIGVMQDTDQTRSTAVADLRQLSWRSRDVPIR